jgi:glycogen debranching enzyme
MPRSLRESAPGGTLPHRQPRWYLRPALVLLIPAMVAAQNPSPAVRPAPTIPRFPLDAGPLFSGGAVRPGVYLGDTGRRAALLGDESGRFEAWVWPVKLVRDLKLAFKTTDSSETIDGGTLARQATARAEGATIVYSHSSFTVRQHVYVPLNEAGGLMLLEVQTLKPLDVHVRMQPDFNVAWPGRLNGIAVSWQQGERRFQISQNGANQYNGLIGSPAAQGGRAPTASAPMQLDLHFEASSGASDFVPIVIAGGAVPLDSVAAVYQRLLTNAARHWRDKVERYRHIRQDIVSITTPDTRLDNALEWSKVNLAQALACNPDFGCGLVGGYGSAGPANYRPGLAWYFGTDAALAALALSATGQFEAAREGLLFLARQQRSDGKIPGEIAHSARLLPWFRQYPFAWSDAEATPLFIVATAAYRNAARDDEFLREVWPNVVKAFRWLAATDTDGDGLLETPRAGRAALETTHLALESWSDIYLAGTWLAALESMETLAGLRGAEDVAREAESLRTRAARSLDNSFWLTSGAYRAFALLRAQTDSAAIATSRTRISEALTAWPAVALSLGALEQRAADQTMREVSSSALTADWGTGALSRYNPDYNPLMQNNGAVSSYLTGMTALAHYRAHRAWAGQDLLRDLGRLTFDFARGRTPSALSGAFYELLESAVPQYTAGSAALTLAIVRGLFGVEVDAANSAVALEPHLPAEWNTASISNIRIGGSRLQVSIERREQRLILHVQRTGETGSPLFVRLSPALPLGARVTRVLVDDRDAPVQLEETRHDVHNVVELNVATAATVELEYSGGIEVVTPTERVDAGDTSEALHVLDVQRLERNYSLMVEGLPGVTYSLALRAGVRVRSVTGAELVEQTAERVQIRFRMAPSNAAYVRREIILRT